MENKSAHFKRLLLIVVFTFIAYSNSFNSSFHFDDYSSIIAHPYVKSIDNILSFFYYDGSPLVGRPVTMATFALNYRIGGLKPFTYHVVNFFIHLSNAILVYWLIVLTFKTPYFKVSVISDSVSDESQQLNYSPIHSPLSAHRRIRRGERVACGDPFTYSPLFIALMFALHPIQTQAVTYVVQRAEILSAFFCLLSLVLFVKARLSQTREVEVKAADKQGKTEAEVKKKNLNLNLNLNLKIASTLIFYSFSLLSAILAMGSKEIAVTLPVVILFYDFFFIADGQIKVISQRWKIHLLFFLTLIPLMYFMGITQLKTFVSTEAVKSPPTLGIYSEFPMISRYEYLITQFRVGWTYIRLLILPINQNVDYNYPISRGLFDPITTLYGGIGIVIVLIVTVFFFKRQRIVSFFILWFFIMLTPTSSVVPLPDVIFEHRMYLASLGYFVIFAMGVFKASESVSVFCDSVKSFLQTRLTDTNHQ